MIAIVSTGYLISKLQNLLEHFGLAMPRVIFLAVLAGAVVYVAKWAMDWFSSELKLFQRVRMEVQSVQSKR